MMKILGIDPGFSYSGYGILTLVGNKVQLLDCGVLKLPASQPLSQRIGIFYAFFTKKITDNAITDLALETPFLGKNAQNFLKLGYLRGTLYLLADTYKLQLHEFSPREVKLSVTGYGGAQKDQVARMLLRLFPGLQMPEKTDITDALAVTLCGLWQKQTAARIV
jgi:crossover junction endodeoxyribonuclease RuvC